MSKSPRHFTAEEKLQALTLWIQNKTLNEIATTLECSVYDLVPWIYNAELQQALTDTTQREQQPNPTDETLEHGFIADVYENWLCYEGTEWGDQLSALNSAYQMGRDYAGLSEFELRQIESILRHHLEIGYADGFLVGRGVLVDDPAYYASRAKQALQAYSGIEENWAKHCAWSPLAVAALERAKNIIPQWMKTETENSP